MNYAKGSSGSHVRRFDAAAFVAASLLAFFIAVAIPHTCRADEATLVWGDVTYDEDWNPVSNNRITIEDGQTYTVPLHTTRSAFVTSPSPLFQVTAMMYRLSDASVSGQKTLVSTFYPWKDTALSWEAPGRYEIDLYASYLTPSLGPFDFLRGLVFGATAYAQSNGDFVQSIFFTIADEAAKPKASSILFIPGVESSRLYMQSGGSEYKLWEPGVLSNQADAQALDLSPDGTSINHVYTKAGAVIDTETSYIGNLGIPVYLDDVYKTFLEQLAGLKASSTINDYEAFSYDWRQSPEDIVNKGTPYDEGTRYIEDDVERLATSSQTGKVTIVAHSNGGLVAKALMQKLAADGKAGLIDKIIFVDVPQTGTPKAIASMLHGDFQQLPQTSLSGIVVSQETARGLAENMPDAFDLLPSPAYFKSVATPVVDFAAAPMLKSKSGVAGTSISGDADLRTFMTTVSGRTKPVSSDIETPDVLSTKLFDSAIQLHSRLDSWTPPPGVQVIQIAGWGIDTPSGVAYSDFNDLSCSLISGCIHATTTRHTVIMTEDGDGTVVTPSQVATTSWDTYYMDIKTYNNIFHTSFQHANVTELKPFQDLLSLLISSSSPNSLPAYVSLNQPAAKSSEKELRLRALSPVSLDVYDLVGNHTGMISNPNTQSDDLYVEQRIPGSYYQLFGEGQYVGLPADGSYHVVLRGKNTGTFTFEVTPVSGGVAGTPVTFADVPVTASSTATLDILSSNPGLASLSEDVNGDGKVDLTIASSSQTQDPLAYAQVIKTSIVVMDIGNPVERQLQAKFENVIHLMRKSEEWNDEDDDGRDNKKTDKISLRVLRKLDKIEIWLQNESQKPISKKIKDERISQSQIQTIIAMIEELKRLVNSNL